jgi:hypothetical protein
MLTKLKFVPLLAVAALGTATPAYADNADRCERSYERLEDRFRAIETRRGWEAASEWWNEKGWPKHYDRCGD